MPDPANDLAGVIELGSTTVRMAVAQRDGSRSFALLNQLVLPVSLGYDAFTHEVLSLDTIESCVEAVRTFRNVLTDEFGLAADAIRVVATSAVREARNREQLIDRLLVATGLRAQVLDETEVSRLTYLAVRPQLRREPFFAQSTTVVIEVGGGSTEILLFRRGRVTAAHVYRLGSLRMLRELGDIHGAGAAALPMLRDYTAQTVEQIADAAAAASRPYLVALGGETRFLCQHLNPVAGSETDSLRRLPLPEMERMIRELLALPVEDIGRRYGLTPRQAETLAPAFVIYRDIARALGAREWLVSNASLRHGLLTEHFHGGLWTREFERQTISSATALARHYRVDLPHARRIAAYAQTIFDFMRERLTFAPSDQTILMVAALLHECGLMISARAYHKHSLYIIQHSDIFGLNAHDTLLAAYVARYHRRTSPRPTHDEYLSLPTLDRIRIAKLAAILRLADCLDVDPTGPPIALRLRLVRKELHVCLHTREDVSLAKRQLGQSGEMFRTVYGLRVLLYAGATES